MSRHAFLTFAAAALGVMYAGLIVALPSGSFSTPEEGIRWLQIDSLWRHRWTTLAIDPPGGEIDAGGDFAPRALIRTEDGLRAASSPAFPLAASVPYAALGTRGAWLIPAAAALLCMAAGTRLARWVVPEDWRALAGVTMVAATPLVALGAMLREETTGALLAVAALIPICKPGGGEATRKTPPGAGRLAASGLLMGLAAVTCPSCAPLIPSAAIAGIAAWGLASFTPGAIALLAASAAPMALAAAMQREIVGAWLAWGSPAGSAIPAPAALAVALLALGAELAPGLPADPRRRFLVVGGAIWAASGTAPALGAGLIALMASAGARRGRAGGRVALAVLVVAVGTGLVAQGFALRGLAAARTYNAALIERIRDNLPEEGVILSDMSDVPAALVTLRDATPVLYTPRGSDIDTLSARLEALGRPPAWIVNGEDGGKPRRGPASMEAGRRFARGAVVELGRGLLLLRYEQQPGVRGFMRTPEGD